MDVMTRLQNCYGIQFSPGCNLHDDFCQCGCAPWQIVQICAVGFAWMICSVLGNVSVSSPVAPVAVLIGACLISACMSLRCCFVPLILHSFPVTILRFSLSSSPVFGCSLPGGLCCLYYILYGHALGCGKLEVEQEVSNQKLSESWFPTVPLNSQ